MVIVDRSLFIAHRYSIGGLKPTLRKLRGQRTQRIRGHKRTRAQEHKNRGRRGFYVQRADMASEIVFSKISATLFHSV